MTPVPARHQPPDGVEEDVGLRLADGRGGLVHDQDGAVVADGLGDLHQLGLGQGQLAHPRARVDVEAQPREQLAGPLVEAPEVDHGPQAPWLTAEVDVLRHRHAADGRQLLRDDGEPVLQGLGRRGEVHQLALHPQRPRVAAEDPHEHVQEGGLAGPVAPAQGVNAARLQGEAAVPERGDAAEGLGDAGGFEKRRDHARPPTRSARRADRRFAQQSPNCSEGRQTTRQPHRVKGELRFRRGCGLLPAQRGNAHCRCITAMAPRRRGVGVPVEGRTTPAGEDTAR